MLLPVKGILRHQSDCLYLEEFLYVKNRPETRNGKFCERISVLCFAKSLPYVRVDQCCDCD